MIKIGKWIARHRVLIFICGILLIIPSMLGIAKTKINYDLLSYLPETLETVDGQNIMVDEFGVGGFSMIVVITEMRSILDKRCFIGGMTGIVTDIKNLCMEEIPIYVVIAAILSFIVLELAGTSFMGRAIASIFRSITASSITTVAGFAALCLMTFALGKNLGIVMAKEAIIGVFCCVTLLPSMILIFDRLIEKTKHKPLIKNLDRPSEFITKHYKVWLALFLVLLGPAIYGNNHTEIYYNIAQSLPDSLPSNMANRELEEKFDITTMHIVMMDKELEAKDKSRMYDEIGEIDGVKWCMGLNTLIDPMVPDFMIPSNVKEMMQGEEYELAYISTEYESATDEMNEQLTKINQVVKSYDETAMVIGEAPLMKDLQDVTDVDLMMVNIASIAAIFIIIMVIFHSISLPVILVAVIEFAIVLNMAIPYYQGIRLPFVASIVVGTIQLGATVDYAILMTSRYQQERQFGHNKKQAITIAHKACMLSIITSGLSFFAATFGIAAYSDVDMIGSICTLLSRGALISMLVVILVLPAMFIIFDKLICKTSIGFLSKGTNFSTT